jgi:hypothetical protein
VSLTILDPTHESDAVQFELPTRLDTLSGKSIAIISNGKQGSGRFFDALESELIGLGASQVVRLSKGNYSAPAEDEVMHQASQCDAIVTGIGD